MDLPTFIQKWSRAELSEQAASQTHFNDLCALLGVKNPIELDPTGEVFTFEKSVAVAGAASLGAKGDRGRADVWYKGKFVWEYKRKGKYADLADAYRQVNQYRDQLGNPPLLIVCDIARTQIHTNFTGFKPEVHTIDLAELDHLVIAADKDWSKVEHSVFGTLFVRSLEAERRGIAEHLDEYRAVLCFAPGGSVAAHKLPHTLIHCGLTPEGRSERVYPTPWTRCDREADYRQAWAEFERHLGKKIPVGTAL